MGAFGAFARKIYENGFSVVPLDGKGCHVPGWSAFCRRMPTEEEFSQWERDFPDANIGLPLGPANGFGVYDCDSFTQSYVERTLELLPHCSVRRIGSKGFAIPVRFTGQVSRKLKYDGRNLAEFLGDGKQLAALGEHPTTGKPYVWRGCDLTDMTRAEFLDAAIDLDDQVMAQLEVLLAKEKFDLDPRDLENNKRLADGTVAAGGRNDRLKSFVGGMLKDGMDVLAMTNKLLDLDAKTHGAQALFLDPGEVRGGSPAERAYNFVTSVTATYVRNQGGVIPAAPSAPGPESVALMLNKKGDPYSNMANVGRILSAMPDLKDSLFYDEFHERILTVQDGVRREWTDDDDLRLLEFIQSKRGVPTMPLSAVQGGVEWFAHAHKRNGLLDWLKALKWDGCKRVDNFFADAMGAVSSPYVSAVSGNFWKAMTARALMPGCKFDNMVVLEGLQGAFKSSALEVIGGEWYAVAGEEVGQKDFLQALAGKLVVEIAELDSFGRAGVTTIKRVLSTRIDSYRASYGRRTRDYKRKCVFVGTTNEDEYLEDATGGRRFWPVHVTRVDLDLIQRNREQLFAEAFHLVRGGETWWSVPDEATKAEQENRRRVDAWESAIESWVVQYGQGYSLTTNLIAERVLKIPVSNLDRGGQMRIAKCMKSLGYKHEWVQRKDDNGRYWVKTN